MAPNNRPAQRTSVPQFSPHAQPDVPELVQGDGVPEPWKELLDLIAAVPSADTRKEMVAGKLQLLKNKLEDNIGLPLKDEVSIKATIFRLEDFIGVNEKLMLSMKVWHIRNMKVAAMVDLSSDRIHVRVNTPQGNVDMYEPRVGFPSEELMTKLRMIAS